MTSQDGALLSARRVIDRSFQPQGAESLRLTHHVLRFTFHVSSFQTTLWSPWATTTTKTETPQVLT